MEDWTHGLEAESLSDNNSLIHWFIKCLLSASSMPYTVLGAQNATINESDKILSNIELYYLESHVKKVRIIT